MPLSSDSFISKKKLKVNFTIVLPFLIVKQEINAYN
jgi:hypothetical protein